MWPLNTLTGTPLFSSSALFALTAEIFQALTVLSLDSVAPKCPFGEMAAAWTQLLCPPKGHLAPPDPSLTPQTSALLSVEADVDTIAHPC